MKTSLTFAQHELNKTVFVGGKNMPGENVGVPETVTYEEVKMQEIHREEGSQWSHIA